MTPITVTVFHNVTRDQHSRPTGMLEGYQPGDPMVRVFTYQADPAGRHPEDIAKKAFTICNGHHHHHDADGDDLSRRYYHRELRLSEELQSAQAMSISLAHLHHQKHLVSGGFHPGLRYQPSISS